MNPNGDFYSEIAQDSIQLDCRLIRFPLSFAPSKTETMTDCSQPYYTLFGGHSATLFRATSPSRDSRRHSLPSAMHLVSTTTLHSPLSTFNSPLLSHLLRKRTRCGNRLILLWSKVLLLRFEHLAQRRSAGCEISVFEPVCLLRGQSD